MGTSREVVLRPSYNLHYKTRFLYSICMLHMANLFKKVFAGASAMAVVVASMNIGAMVSAANLVSAEFTAAYTWGFQN